MKSNKIYLDFEKITILIESLLEDPDYYVQKALGWNLRELIKLYPKQGLDFLEKNSSILSPIALSTALENLSPSQKKYIRLLRAA
ncbi:MAG TPA: DNA alkylation repair protein [Candidatus Babeliaceae bacterium]|nr:DNA alkylation repair protein [Candidatus Babeliaceae bacterium]